MSTTKKGKKSFKNVVHQCLLDHCDTLQVDFIAKKDFIARKDFCIFYYVCEFTIVASKGWMRDFQMSNRENKVCSELLFN